MDGYDVAVVGGGIIGLAHAYVAARAGLKVVVCERHPRALGASIRNFGFITVTGQQCGDIWRTAMRSRDIWANIAPEASIPVLHHGLWLSARYAESAAILDAFMATEMAEACRLMRSADAPLPLPEGWALHSPHELRVESATALPALTQWLAERHGVTFRFATTVTGVETGRLYTAAGDIAAERIIICPGDDFTGLFPERLKRLQRCQLQMLRLADPGFRLPGAIMSDLGLIRYLGYAAFDAAHALRQRLQAERQDALDAGVHLIVTQSQDGTLVVGDSHHYGAAPEPFASAGVDDLILDEYRAVLGEPPTVVARWTGTYATADDSLILRETPLPGVQLVIVTCGAGASLSFGLAEQTFSDIVESQA